MVFGQNPAILSKSKSLFIGYGRKTFWQTAFCRRSISIISIRHLITFFWFLSCFSDPCYILRMSVQYSIRFPYVQQRCRLHLAVYDRQMKKLFWSKKNSAKMQCFCLHYTQFYYKIGIRVVESGDKWSEVVNQAYHWKPDPRTVADHICRLCCMAAAAVRAHSIWNRVIDDVYGRIQSHNWP